MRSLSAKQQAIALVERHGLETALAQASANMHSAQAARNALVATYWERVVQRLQKAAV